MVVNSDILPKTKEEYIAYLDEGIKKINHLKDIINKIDFNDEFTIMCTQCHIADILFEIEFHSKTFTQYK